MADETKITYVSLNNLEKYDGLLKQYVDQAVDAVDAKSLKTVAWDNATGTLKFYREETVAEGTVEAFKVELVTWAEIAAINSEIDQIQADLLALKNLVGVLPTDAGEGVDTVVKYIDKKTANIATTDGLDELEGKVDQNVTDIETLEGLVGTEKVETQIQNAITELDLPNTYEEKGAAKAVQGETESTVKAVEDRVATAEGEIDALQEQIQGLSGAMHFEGVKDALPEDVSGYEAGDVIIVGDKEYVFNNGAFVEFGDSNPNAQAITDLTGRVSSVEGKVEVLEGEMDTVQTGVAAAATKTEMNAAVATLEGVDAELSGRIDTLAGKFEGENSVDNKIEAAKEAAISAATESAASDATEKANKALADAKSHTDGEIDKVEATIASLTDSVNEKATQSDLEALTNRVSTAEGEIDTLQTEMDAVEAKAAANEEKINSFVPATDAEIEALFQQAQA